MRSVIYEGPRKLVLAERDVAEPRRGQVRVAVIAAGICGSDVHGYTGLNGRRAPGTVMGHEAVGIVDAVGPEVEAIEAGQPVVINPVVGCGRCPFCERGEANLCPRRRLYGCTPVLPGAFADFITVAQANAVPYGGHHLELGALVEPLAVGVHAAAVGCVEPSHEVLVVGGGPIGLGTALAVRHRGATATIAEPSATRRGLAEALGFATLDPFASPPPVDSFHVAVETVGQERTLRAALDALQPRGTLVFLASAAEAVPMPVTPLSQSEKRIVGSSCYTSAEFTDTAVRVALGEREVLSLIEHRVGYDGLHDAFESYAEHRLPAMKTLLVP